MFAIENSGPHRLGRSEEAPSKTPTRGARKLIVGLSFVSLALVALFAGCKGKESEGGPPGGSGRPSMSGSGGSGMSPGGGPGMGDGGEIAAVPVETTPVERRSISSFIQTNGTLEAENEVDLVARVSAPIIDLRVEEGLQVQKGQILARLDDAEIRSQLEISRVNLQETTQALERARVLHEGQLISPEAYDQALSRHEAAQAQYDSNRVQLGYTVIRAPFSGLIIARYIKFAEQVGPNTPLFRISDFDPLLAPIQVPERELPRLHVGQDAYLTVEAWGERRFPARVLRISPVVDAATGTVKVTLEVDSQEELRPGMFASVFVEVDSHDDALVIPRAALSLDSLGDTVYVAAEGRARRREVELGFQEGDLVEILSGLTEGEQVVVVGQDGLSDGTPVQTLTGGDTASPAGPGPGQAAASPSAGVPGSGRPDPSSMTPEQIERLKEMMRARGMTEEQIEERLKGGGPQRPQGQQ